MSTDDMYVQFVTLSVCVRTSREDIQERSQPERHAGTHSNTSEQINRVSICFSSAERALGADWTSVQGRLEACQPALWQIGSMFQVYI